MWIAALLGALAGSLPGAHAYRACAAAGPYWPTMTLALQGKAAWVACKQQSQLVRVDLTTGKTRAVKLNGQPIAVVNGLGSVWTLDSGGILYRIDTARLRIRAQRFVPASAPYNLWVGGGSIWTADDQGARVVRLSPTLKVLAQPPVGDGPASMAFSGTTAWVMNHRDRVLTRIDLRTNKAKRLGVLGEENAAPERMVFANGFLWVTGRGADLYKVDGTTGRVVETIEIGASGIDIARGTDALFIPTRSADVDATGLPTMDALKRVSIATGSVTTVATPTARVDVHGLLALRGAVWIADNTNGWIYRLP
jgi:outer membrane protein assembly factor BamB